MTDATATIRCGVQRLLASVALAATLATAGSLVGPATALAKSYVVDDVVITATVDPSGDMQVSETRTLEFDGDYTRVYWDLDTSGSQGIASVPARKNRK